MNLVEISNSEQEFFTVKQRREIVQEWMHELFWKIAKLEQENHDPIITDYKEAYEDLKRIRDSYDQILLKFPIETLIHLYDPVY